MLRNPSRLMRAPPVAPHANGGTYLGGRTASKTLAPVPTTVPVASSVPIAVLAWSPMRLPNSWRPVSSGVPATSSRTRPYVFFRFDVIVPAPRFAQRPITEWPTKPSWALLAYPRNTQFDTSPRTLQRGPIAVTRTELGPALEHDGTAPDVEYHPRLDHGVVRRDRGGVAQHRAARGNRVGVAEQRPQVGVEQRLERGDQVVDAVQHGARHLDRPCVRLGPVPRGTRPHAPAHRDAAAREPERAVGEGG